MKNIFITLSFLLLVTTAFAQGIDDACLYSQTFYHGTAKAIGMGNALGAVGSDMTAVCINPAGLGLYRSSEFSFTLNLLDNYGTSNYYGTNANANRFRVSLPNINYINTKQRSNYRKLRFTQFGIGLTRTNDFNIHSYAKGINPTSSKIDNYLAQIDGLSPTDIQELYPFDIYPAWNTYLIDIYQDEAGEYYGSPVPQGGIWQSQDNAFKGRAEEWTFAGSLNYDERLFIGISVGLNHIKRFGTRVFEEWMPEQATTSTNFNRWNFTQDLTSIGWGGNLKVGLIYNACHWLRIGAAFHSPTIFGFDETWQTETESEIGWVTRKYISPESHYEYTFIKPLKWIGSLAFVIGQEALISFDAEYQNYGAAFFDASDWDYSAINEEIKSTYARSFNFRLGGEWRISNAYLRLGAAYYGSPYGLGKADGSVKKASCGLSLPLGTITTIDFAYELSYGKNLYTLYDAGSLGIEPVTQKQFMNNLALTLRLRF